MAAKKAKKGSAKKTSAKRAPPKKAPPKKAAPKKAAPKKAAPKKAAPKKVAPKKAAAKKTAAKKSSSGERAGSLFDSVALMRAALRSGGEGLRDDFDRKNKAHQNTLLQLSQLERVTLLALLGGPGGLRRRFPNGMALLAEEWAIEGRGKDAIALFDALVEVDHQETGAYGAALWAIQDDNTHLGIDEARARNYLARCTPYGKELPDIHFNAMFVLLELGDGEGALVQLRDAVRYGFPKDAIRVALATERLCVPIRNDPRFSAAVAGA